MPQSHSVKTRDNSPSRTFNKLFYGLGLLSIIAVALAVSVLSQAAGERGKRAARNSAATERVNVRQKSPAHAAANALLAAPMATITVDRTDDVPSASGCTGAPSDCSLRGAVTFANLNPGTTISVPAGTYQLTIDGGFVEGFNGDNSVGDLDITANNTAIMGAGAASTIIQQTRPNDRVIEVNPFLDAGLVTTISDVTITGGRETTGVGGGAIISGSIDNDLSITNCIISGNSATGVGTFGGGGISHLGGDLNISGTTFSGNSTSSSGGAVGYSAGDPLGRTPSAGTLSVSGSTFSSNTAGSVAAGGGAMDLFDFNLSTGTYSINSSSFSGNSATNGNGGAIVIESGPLTATTSSFTSNSAGNRGGAIYSSGSASVAYSRLVGNSVPVAANGLTLFRTNTSFTAEDNWWGSNSGPGANDFRATDGSVSPATYLQLRISASPNELCPTETSTLTADIKQRNAGSPLTTELNGLQAFPTPAATIFNNASLGTLSGASTQFVNGVATATYTAGNTPGNGGADATADNQTVSATIIVRTAEASDPADQTVCQGDTAVFSTTASGSGPFTYAWTLDGSPFGGNTDSISVPTGSLSIGAHTVTVTVSSSCGSITHSATLTVQEPTSTSDPTDQTVCQGADAMFSTTASGTGPFSYAWKLDGAPFGGDTSSITVPTGALSVGVHTVEVTVTGECGSATQSATLTVQESTSTTDPADQTVCEGDNAIFSTTASGTGPFTYAWTVDGNPAGTSPSITVPTGSLSVGVHTVEVTVSGTCGSATQSATLTVQESTSITDPPDQAVCPGTDATFSTIASGTGPFSYAWKLDGNPIGGDNSSVTIPTGSLSSGDHTVTVTVSGTCGSATQSATLTVRQLTSTTDPSDVSACQGGMAAFSTTASGTGPFTFVWKQGATVLNHGDLGGRVSITNTTSGSTLVINNVQAGDAGGYSVETTGACNTATQNFNLAVDSAPPVIVLNSHPTILWPPNHKYRTVNVSNLVTSVSDSCDTNLGVGDVVITSVSSDEPENGFGDGFTNNDIVIAPDCKSVKLRAERKIFGNGRVYRVNMKVTDSSGNTTTATAKVYVLLLLHVVDDGPAAGYTVNSNCP